MALLFTTKAAIRAVVKRRIKAITFDAATGDPWKASRPFTEYTPRALLRFAGQDEDAPIPEDRAFQVEIGPAQRTGVENIAQQDKNTVFRVIVAYQFEGDVEGLDDRIAEDYRRICNALRADVHDELALYPYPDGTEPEPARGPTHWVLVAEFSGSHSEKDWGYTA